MENNRTTNSPWRRFGKRAGIALAIFLGIVLLIQILFSFFAESYLKQKMESAIEKSSPHLKAKISNLALSTLQRQIRIEGIRIWRDKNYQDTTDSPPLLDSLTIHDINVNGIHGIQLLIGKKAKINWLSINKPTLYAFKPQSHSSNSGKKEKLNTTIYKKIHSYYNALEIRDFRIQNLSIKMQKTPSSQDPWMLLHNFSIRFSGIRLDSSWAQRHPILPSNKFRGRLDSLRWSNSKLYNTTLGNIWFSSKDSSLSIKDVALNPQLPKEKFSKSVGHEVDRIDWKTNLLQVFGIDFSSLVEDRTFKASNIKASNTKLNIFHDKRPPGGPTKLHTFPHLLFRQLKFPVSVDSITVDSADISYSEHKNLVPEAGTITFQNTNATIKNAYNRSFSDTLSKTITMHATSDIMGVGHLDANFSFPDNSTGTHKVSGSIGPMEIKKINEAVENLGSVHVENGKIHSIKFDMQLGPQKSTGSLKMHYTDLKIKIMKFDGVSDPEQKKITSFLANNFVIKQNNEPPLREGKISFERIKEKSIFNYWWKSLLSGLKSSVGL